MPLALAAGVAGLSMAGLPPMLGFIGKELLYEAKLQAPAAWGVTAAGVAANASFVAVAGLVALRPFWGRPGPAPGAHDRHSAVAGPLVLAASACYRPLAGRARGAGGRGEPFGGRARRPCPGCGTGLTPALP